MQAAPGMEGDVSSGHGHSTAMLQRCVCVLCSCRLNRLRGVNDTVSPCWWQPQPRCRVCLQLVKSDASTEGATSNLVMHLQRGTL